MIVNPYSNESIPTYFERGGHQKKNQRVNILHDFIILEPV